MARIAYVDHSFHRTTKSTGFLPDVLRRHGHVVEHFWDDAWQGGASVRWTEVSDHDIVIMFQSYCPPETLHFRRAHPNVVYIPMLDQFCIYRGPILNLSHFWEPFQGSKVLNFSNAVHCVTTGFGIVSHFVRYYQPTVRYLQPPQHGLHGFFWLRRESELPWRLIRKLIEGTHFDSFHIHSAVDPGFPAAEHPSAEDIATFNITTSRWFENKADLNTLMARANVYFAPRLEEGIGQSFLEAMARGQCVVAPNHGTMNEYILPGVNGLLYDIENPAPLDFSNAHQLGRQAKIGTEVGRRRWDDSEQMLVDFIQTPSRDLYVGRYQHPALAEAETYVEPLAPDRLPEWTWVGALRGAAGRYALLRWTRVLWRPLKNLIARTVGPDP